MFLLLNKQNLPVKRFNPNFVACFVFFGIAISFHSDISSSDISTKRLADDAILRKNPIFTYRWTSLIEASNLNNQRATIMIFTYEIMLTVLII